MINDSSMKHGKALALIFEGHPLSIDVVCLINCGCLIIEFFKLLDGNEIHSLNKRKIPNFT